jgi:UDP-N-acetylglucosamine 2-epimerase (non-hydrolysing)
VGIPAVDIGRRQAGRLRGANVLHAEDGFTPVADAVRQGLDPGFAHSWGHLINPYGNGQASDAVADVIASAGRPARGKRFLDTELNLSEEYR